MVLLVQVVNIYCRMPLGSKAVDLMPLVGSSDAFLKALIDGVPGVVAGAVLGSRSSLSSGGDRGVDGARRV